MSKVHQVAVIKAIGSAVRNGIILLSGGKLSILQDGESTNTPWTESVPWNLIKSFRKIPYAAGAYKTIEINFDSLLFGFNTTALHTSSHTFTFYPAGQAKIPFTIQCNIPSEILGSDQRTVYAYMRDMLYDAITANSACGLIATKENTYRLRVQGVFGTAGLDNKDFTFSTTLSTPTEFAVTLVETVAPGTSSKITCGTHGLAVGDMVNISGVVWTAEPNAGDFSTNAYLITAKTTTTITVAHAFTGATYGSGGVVTEAIQRVHVAYAKPEGTVKVVNDVAQATLASGNETYTTYEIEHGLLYSTFQGLEAQKPLKSVLYVESDVDEEIVPFMDEVLAGVRTPLTVTKLTKADPGVVTVSDADHYLVAGDWVQFGASVVNPTKINGLICQVASVEDAQNFTLDWDASGITNEETSAICTMYNFTGLYNGR